MEPHVVEQEETEHIPWAMLAEEMGDDPRRRRMMVATVAVGLLAALVAFLWFRRPPGVMVEVPETAVTAAAIPAPAVVVTTVPLDVAAPAPGTLPVTPTPPSTLYAEADLMAVLPEQEVRLVAARAEVVVADHFTVDGFVEEGGDEGEAYSWVEWVRSAEVVPDAGGYQVTVLFRTIARPDPETTLVRSPVRAVTVPVAVAGDGSLIVTDLPSPADPPSSTETIPDAGDEDVPDEVIAEVTDRLGDLGFGEVVVAGGSRQDDGWRIVVHASDGTGPAWPMVMYIGGE